MAIYTQLTGDDIASVVLTYGLATVESVSPFAQGGENSNYRLKTAGNSYVLTICESKSAKETTMLVRTLKYLESEGFWTTRIIPTTAGQYQSELSGKPMLLKTYLDGEVFESLPLDSLEALGTSLGKLHEIPAPNFLPQQVSIGIQTFQPLRREFGKAHPFLDWLKEIEEFLNNALDHSYPVALIHADVFADNVVHVEDRGPVIMDFEEAAVYYRMFDVGMTIVGTCRGRVCGNRPIDRHAQSKFMTSYRETVQLLPHESDALSVFIIYAAAAMASWRFRQYNMLHPELGKQEHYRELQLIAIEELARN